jgi:putative OPT family oligopeptide transporter
VTSNSADAPATTTAHVRELTLRGLIIGVLACCVFTAANVYLGLKVGLTFASAIPAAVISMAILRALRNTTIHENMVVQTVASAAGTLSSVIFVLPGLVMVGWWTGFPFWTSFSICAIGGILGVMYTIPLRRALVTSSDLPYPEGVAAAEVLKIGFGDQSEASVAESKTGLTAIIGGTLASAGMALLAGLKVAAGEVGTYFKVGKGATGLNGSLSLALVGAGHLMGIAVGVSFIVGLIIAWGIATPLLTAGANPADFDSVADFATTIWKTKVRFLGAGAIGAAAIWTMIKLAIPVWDGFGQALAATRKMSAGEGAALPRTEQDIPLTVVGWISLGALVPLAVLIWSFLSSGPLVSVALPLIVSSLIYIVIAGFLVAAVCGFMAGLIGSSNSPVSGVAILAVLGAAFMLASLGKAALPASAQPALVAFALFVTAIVIAVAVIANDNLQDLKTGQLVDATPWRQQVALMVGVVAGAVVIPPVLNLLNHAYGFAGAPNLNAISDSPLPAPQATLISTLAKGVIQGDLDWGLLGIGVLVGIVLVIIDESLRRTGRYSLPPLGVALAIYLPAAVTTPVILGSVLGLIYDRAAAKLANGDMVKRIGVLMASGLIVGESLFSVSLAGLIVATGKESPLAIVGESFEKLAEPLGLAIFLGLAVGLYLWTRNLARKGA